MTFLGIFRQYNSLDFFLDFFNFRFRKQIWTFTFPEKFSFAISHPYPTSPFNLLWTPLSWISCVKAKKKHLIKTFGMGFSPSLPFLFNTFYTNNFTPWEPTCYFKMCKRLRQTYLNTFGMGLKPLPPPPFFTMSLIKLHFSTDGLPYLLDLIVWETGFFFFWDIFFKKNISSKYQYCNDCLDVLPRTLTHKTPLWVYSVNYTVHSAHTTHYCIMYMGQKDQDGHYA